MAAGFSFGSSSSTPQTGLFGAKSTASSAFGNAFGAPAPTATTGFSLAKTSASTGFTFGSSTTQKATTAATNSLGLSFGAPTFSTASSSTGLFGAKTTASLGFGSTTATTSSAFKLGGFGTSTTSTSNTFKLGGFGAASSAGFSLTSSAVATSSASKIANPPVNPKEEKVPAELKTLVTDLETFIKSQKDTKEEISKISCEEITKTRAQLIELKQSVALVANGLQRDSVAVDNLKHEVGQEMKNAEIAHSIKDLSISLRHDFTAPMEYFARLVYSFEMRINCYRQEIEELETFLSSSTPQNSFSSQDLLNVLRRVNESFIGLASELQQVHEAVKVIKEKYLHFRRVVYNDMADPFTARKKEMRGPSSFVGPSPFPVVQGAGVMASALKQQKAPTASLSTTNNSFGFGTSLSRPPGATGLTRSLSFGGSGKSSAFQLGSSLSSGTSLFGNKSQLGASASLNLAAPTSSSASPFMLQKPPSGKRGKLF